MLRKNWHLLAYAASLMLVAALVALLLVLSFSKAGDGPVRPTASGCSPTPKSGYYPAPDKDFAPTNDLPDFPGASGRVSLRGVTRGSDCEPSANTFVMIWASREGGEYTSQSYAGVYSDDLGRYEFTLPMPESYLESPDAAHIHVAARIGGEEVTATLYPGSERSLTLDLVPGAPNPENTDPLGTSSPQNSPTADLP